MLMSIDWFPMGDDGRSAPVGFVTYAPALIPGWRGSPLPEKSAIGYVGLTDANAGWETLIYAYARRSHLDLRGVIVEDDESGHRWREAVREVEQQQIGAVLVPRHPWLPGPDGEECPSMCIRRALCIHEVEELGALVIEIA